MGLKITSLNRKIIIYLNNITAQEPTTTCFICNVKRNKPGNILTKYSQRNLWFLLSKLLFKVFVDAKNSFIQLMITLSIDILRDEGHYDLRSLKKKCVIILVLRKEFKDIKKLKHCKVFKKNLFCITP